MAAHRAQPAGQGLLMYLQPADVFALITDCARRFPGLWGWPTPILVDLPGLGAHRPAISLATFADHQS